MAASVIVGGGASVFKSLNDCIVGGSFVVTVVKSTLQASGGVLVAGQVVSGFSVEVQGSGGILLDGAAANSHFLAFDLEAIWSINEEVSYDLEAMWSVGEQLQRWYRVQGCCNYPTAAGSGLPDGPQFPGGCDVMGIQTDDSMCVGAIGKQQFIQNILARNVEEVCNELTRSRLNWQVCSIKRWSRPADPTFVEPGDNCNLLEEVPYSEIPECIEFTLQTKGLVNIGVTISIFEDFHIAANPNAGGSRKSFVGGSYLSGGLIVFDEATVPKVLTSGNADTIIKSGGTTPTTNEYFLQGLGGVELGGSASVLHTSGSGIPKDLQSYVTFINAKVFIPTNPVSGNPEEEIIFGEPTNLTPLIVPTAAVSTACASCTAMPLSIYMQHNLSYAAVFNDFLIRNGYTLPNILHLSFNSRLNVWVATLHYTGLADDNANNESWRFTFDFDCTNNVGGEETGNSVIKFGMTVVRKNIGTGVAIDTRIMMLFPSSGICGYIRNFYADLNVSLNTKTTYVANDAKVVPDNVIFYDKIGLFSSTYWNVHPELLLRFSKANVEVRYDRRDISSILPKPANLRGVGTQVFQTPAAVV